MESKIPPLIMYDDLCRAVGKFTNDEDDYVQKICNIISSLDEWRKRWSICESELQNVRKLYTDLLKEKNEGDTKISHIQKAFEAEMKRRIKAEHERDVLERKLDAARILLTNDPNVINDETREKLAFWHATFLDTNTNYKDSMRLETINESSGSINSSDDFSYDRTDDNIDESNHKEVRKEKRTSVRTSHSENKRHPSAPPMNTTPPKKTKISSDTITFPDSEVRRNYSEPRLTLNKSCSESTNFYTDDRGIYPNINVEESIISSDQKCVTPEQKNRYSTIEKMVSVSKLGNRRHDFCSKTIIKPETCTPCGKKISFGKSAFRCKECRAVCHIECREKVPLPCISAVNTPNSRGKMVPGVIADFAPLTTPMIPAIVIHCINEIESRGLKDLGIYRVPGSDKDVKDLKEKFLRGKGVPNLSRIHDIHSICGCLKDFLRSLKEPLIVNSKWNDFVNAAECTDINRMYEAISQLPRPNSDTLAFLILHLRRVADSKDCKMPASNLAKIFGPTIVGYSSVDPDHAVMLAETKKQAAVMERLLSIPEDYWGRKIEPENTSTDILETQINERRLSMGKGKLVHTPLAPRDSVRNIKNGRKSMTFSSPMVL